MAKLAGELGCFCRAGDCCGVAGDPIDPIPAGDRICAGDETEPGPGDLAGTEAAGLAMTAHRGIIVVSTGMCTMIAVGTVDRCRAADDRYVHGWCSPTDWGGQTD